MLPSNFSRSFYLNEQFQPPPLNQEKQLRTPAQQPYNYLINGHSNLLHSQSIPYISNSINDSAIPFNNIFFEKKKFTNTDYQKQSVPNYIHNSIENLLKIPPPRTDISLPIEKPVIELSNIPSQGQVIFHPMQPSSLNEFLKFPPPNININRLQPVINDIINMAPSTINVNLQSDKDTQINVFNSKNIYQNYNYINPFSNSTQNSSRNNSSISGCDDLDKLFLIDFTAKIKRRLHLESSKKNEQKELKSDLDEDKVQNVDIKYKKLLKKRERIKRNRQIKLLETENSVKRREKIEKKFDEWQKNIAIEEKIIKEKLELQKAVEITMSEVIFKITDLKKQMKLLNQLKKLRKLRAEQRKKNDLSNEEFNLATKNFELRTGALEKFINDQMSTYKDEEHTLKVMLNIEAEVDAEMQIRRQKKDVQMRTSLYKKEINEYLFGQKLDVKPEDPMFSFYRHYKMADTNIDSFLAIRSEWDNCIVNIDAENSSSVNLTYFLPSSPSSSQWAKYVIK